jgi:tetratricopeptide (TPR) repeat protein
LRCTEKFPESNRICGIDFKECRTGPFTDNAGKALLQLGVIKMETGDSIAAKQYLTRALKVYEDMNSKIQMAMVLANMAHLETEHQKIIDIMLKAQAIYDEIGPTSIGSIGNITNLGQAYYDLALDSQPADKAI